MSAKEKKQNTKNGISAFQIRFLRHAVVFFGFVRLRRVNSTFLIHVFISVRTLDDGFTARQVQWVCRGERQGAGFSFTHEVDSFR